MELGSMTTTLDQAPRYSKDDRVTIRGTGSQRAIWIVDSVLLPTSTNPKIGYWLKAGNGHSRAVDEDRLTLAGQEQ